jgi:acetyltransferase
LTEYSREFRAGLPHLPFLQEVDKSVRMLGRVADYVERGRHRTRPAKARANAATKKAAATLARASRGKTQPVALNEPASKAILAAYGVPVLDERLARSAAAAAAAAAEIGFPVVLKGVSADLPHKSDAGAVLIGLGSANAVAKGFERITKNVARAKPGLKLDGVLVAPMAAGGLELALGIANDPEVGPVIMFGQGGVALELYRDVAIAAPDLDTAAAHRLIARTKVGTLMGGFRGGPRYDTGAVADALVALGRLARTHGDQIDAVDVNPFVVRPRGKGAVALDGLVIVRPRRKP